MSGPLIPTQLAHVAALGHSDEWREVYATPEGKRAIAVGMLGRNEGQTVTTVALGVKDIDGQVATFFTKHLQPSDPFDLTSMVVIEYGQKLVYGSWSSVQVSLIASGLLFTT